MCVCVFVCVCVCVHARVRACVRAMSPAGVFAVRSVESPLTMKPAADAVENRFIAPSSVLTSTRSLI